MATRMCFAKDVTGTHETAPGILTIDLDALGANYQTLCQKAAPALVGAVIKADAYGLGASHVAPILHEAGCRHFFVAQLDEALALVPVLPANAQLFVLNGLFAGTEAACADAGVIPVLNSLEQVSRWSQLGVARGLHLPAVLQIDTGMERLGLDIAELNRLSVNPRMLDGVRLLYVMSHPACADEPENARNVNQLQQIQGISRQFPGVAISFANSGAMFLDAAFVADLSRPGIAIYGGAPHPGKPNPLCPVLRLDVRVIQIRDIPAGAFVGYGDTYLAERPMRVATIAAGYADGLPRSLSNRGAAYLGHNRLPIIGRVSMDTTIIDISAVDPDLIRPNTLVEVIGPNQSLDDLAIDADTISYEILTRLGRRYRRIFSHSQRDEVSPLASLGNSERV